MLKIYKNVVDQKTFFINTTGVPFRLADLETWKAHKNMRPLYNPPSSKRFTKEL